MLSTKTNTTKQFLNAIVYLKVQKNVTTDVNAKYELTETLFSILKLFIKFRKWHWMICMATERWQHFSGIFRFLLICENGKKQSGHERPQ